MKKMMMMKRIKLKWTASTIYYSKIRLFQSHFIMSVKDKEALQNVRLFEGTTAAVSLKKI